MLDCKEATLLDSFSVKVKNVSDDVGLRKWLDELIRSAALHTMMISPAMAKVMMERNTGNRTLSATRVARYAKDMKDGKWKLTGEPIIFSREGILNDGQTRLSACIQAGVSFESDVRFGIERDAFKVTGCGAKRSLSDVFSIMGEKNSTRLASALNWLNRYLHGMAAPCLSHTEGQALLSEHSDIRKSIAPGGYLHSHTRLMEPGLAVFLHYTFALKDADKADSFFEFLNEGLGATNAKDPRRMLRERLISNKGSQAQLGSMEIAALTIKAWNAYRQGKILGTLKWVTNPPKGAPEAFPRAAWC